MAHGPALDALLHEEVERFLGRHDRPRVLEGNRLVGLRDSAQGLVAQVGEHEDPELQDRVRTPPREPFENVLPAGALGPNARYDIDDRQDRERNREPEHPSILTIVTADVKNPLPG